MKKYQIPDVNQNYWQLASIQNASMGLPGILIGGQLAKEYGSVCAIISIFIGNLVIWMIGIGILSMAERDRKHAMQNVGAYLGKNGAIFASLILVAAILTWYIMQINAATIAISTLFEKQSFWPADMNIRLGAALGFIIALISIGGIVIIKWICTIVFPFLFIFSSYAVSKSNYLSQALSGTIDVSFFAIIITIAISLPGIINLPTFFRHSRSKADSFLALSIMTVFVSLFQISSILLGISQPEQIFSEVSLEFGISINHIITIIFIISSLICVNLVNIYFASAGWEMIIPHRWSAREYAIMGLLGTALYTFIQVSKPMEFLENLTDAYIWVLGAILLISFLLKIVIQHRPRPLEKLIGNICWLIGCIIATIVLSKGLKFANQALIAGVGASILAFFAVIFYEETDWSIKTLSEKK